MRLGEIFCACADSAIPAVNVGNRRGVQSITLSLDCGADAEFQAGRLQRTYPSLANVLSSGGGKGGSEGNGRAWFIIHGG